MADEPKGGSNTLLKWSGAAFITSFLAGAMAKGIEETERQQGRSRARRRGNPSHQGLPQVVRDSRGRPVMLDGRPMLEHPYPPVANPGVGGAQRRFMDPRIPGPGFIPAWQRRGINPEDIIAERERRWYEAHGYEQRDGRWVRKKKRKKRRDSTPWYDLPS